MRYYSLGSKINIVVKHRILRYFILVCFFCFSAVASAVGQLPAFPYFESFKNSTAVGIFGFGETTTEGKPNSAFLTAAGNTYSLTPGQQAAGAPIDENGKGYLRLTDNTNNQTGYVYNETRFPSTDGIHVEFEYYTYGGLTERKADGITLFLFDADVPAFSIGAFGGSLGYSQKHDPSINPPVLNLPGVSGGFLGVGIDEYGNFANPIEGRQGGVINPEGGSDGRHNSSVTLRGDGNGAALTPDNYEYITHERTDNPANGNFQIAGGTDGRLMIPQPSPAFPGYRKVIVDVVPNDPNSFTVTVDVIHGNQAHRIINQQYTPSSGTPSHLKYGFASSTGAYTNYHEIRSIDIVVPAGVIKAPVAVADAATTPKGIAKVLNIVSNDYDPNGNVTLDLSSVDLDPATAGRQTTFSVPGEGNYSIDDSGNLTFTPDVSFLGVATPIEYVIYDNGQDLHGAIVTAPTISNTAEVTFTVIVNNPPVAVADAYTVAEGGTLTVDAPGVLANDSDPEGGAITATVITGPIHGTLTLNADGSFIYIHDGSETLTDSYTYNVNDGAFNSSTVTVSITVTAVNDPPVSVADGYTVAEGGTLTIPAATGVLSNDSNPEGNPITAILVSGPSNGTLTLSANGSFTYVHNGSETTTDSYTYKVNDGTVDGNTVTVTLTITAVNDPPVAVADAYMVAEGGTLTVAAATGVLSNDSDAEGGAITAILVSGPSNGTLTFSADGSFTYIHNGSETTTDSYTYKVNDGTIDGNTVTVTLAIIPVNDPPVAVADGYTVAEGGILTIPAATGVLSNDSDPEGNPITAILVSGPSNGTLTLSANGSFTYVHNGSETTTDSYTYKVNDGTVDGNTVTVTLTITAVNDPPVAVADAYTVAEGGTLTVAAATGVLSNDSDAEGSAITAILVSGPSNGTLTFRADGSFTYIHNGSETTTDSYTYKVNDATIDGNTVTVSITITNVNDPPVAVADIYTVPEGGTLTVPASTGVLKNDTDAEGDVLTAILVSGTVNGSLTLNADGSFVYTHNGSQSPTDSFTYKINDGKTDGNTVTVTINAINILPVIADVAKAGFINTPLAFGALDFASKFTDTDPLVKIRIISIPGDGVLRMNGADIVPNQEIVTGDIGKITFVPNPGFVGGPVSFQWNGSDGTGYATVPKNVIITITGTSAPANAPPVAFADSYSTTKGGTLIISAPGVLSNDTDADGNPITAITVTNPVNGTVTLNSNGSFTYIHNNGPSTADSFTYKVNDGITDGNTVTVNIAVSAGIVPPVVSNISKTGTGFTPITFSTEDFTARFVNPNGAPLAKIRIIALPPFGVLNLNGARVTAGQEIPAASLSGLTYVPAINWIGTTSFPWNGSDGSSYAVNDATVEISVLLSGDPSAKIGVAKSLASVKSGLNGSYDVSFLFTLKNYGLYRLENVSLRDNLLSAFPGTELTIKSVTTSGNLKANAAFNGTTDSELVLLSSTLEGGEEARVNLDLNIRLISTGGLFQNSAVGAGISSVNGVRVSDVSTNGVRPDPLLNDDVTSSDATPVQLDAKPAYVPAGFSPNGDGMNDKFVIQNTQGKRVSLEVYNRWGNRIYKSTDYQNEWDGRVTEGLFIGRDIPDGTYFYVIVIDTTDRYTGFITVNR